jgi:hypothetical protein
VGESDAAGPPTTPPPPESPPPSAAPPARGWYRVPDNPNYEHFWDGRTWTSQRYWGGASAGVTGPSHAPPPGAGSWGPPPSPPGHKRFEAEDHAPPPSRPRTNRGSWATPSPTSSSADLGDGGPQERFYSLTTIIVPPVFVAFFILIAVSELSSHSGRSVGIGAAILAVLFVLIFSRRPYVAIARRNGSLTFKALVGSKNTAISRISRIQYRTGGPRGGSSWAFQFDGTEAVLADFGGKALARYVIERNRDVAYPVHRFRR